MNILSTAAKVCLTSSILALVLGVPIGILLGAERFPGCKVLLAIALGLILLSLSLLVNAMLLITHSIQQARRMARRVAFLHQGKLIEQGETDVVLMKPTQAETKQFLDFYGI